MTNHKKLVLFLVLCLGMISLGIAQDNVPPQTQLNKLEKRLKQCEKGIMEADLKISRMESYPESATLGEYRFAKKYLKNAKECQKQLLEEINRLKKEYPYWPDASDTQNLDDRQNHGSYDDFMKSINRISMVWEKQEQRFNNLDEPSH